VKNLPPRALIDDSDELEIAALCAEAMARELCYEPQAQVEIAHRPKLVKLHYITEGTVIQTERDRYLILNESPDAGLSRLRTVIHPGFDRPTAGQC